MAIGLHSRCWQNYVLDEQEHRWGVATGYENSLTVRKGGEQVEAWTFLKYPESEQFDEDSSRTWKSHVCLS